MHQVCKLYINNEKLVLLKINSIIKSYLKFMFINLTKFRYQPVYKLRFKYNFRLNS